MTRAKCSTCWSRSGGTSAPPLSSCASCSGTAACPETITTDKLPSYGAAVRDLGLASAHRPGGMRQNNRAENSHLAIRRRERKQQNFISPGSAQRFLAIHGPIYNSFNLQPHLVRRPMLRKLPAQTHHARAAASAAA